MGKWESGNVRKRGFPPFHLPTFAPSPFPMRYTDYAKLDTQPIIDGDDAFTGVNAKLSRAKLPPGTLALAINKRLRTGTADTRPGTVMPVFANNIGLTGTEIRGAGVYSNPNGEETLLVASPTAVWRVRDGSAPLSVKVEGDNVGSYAEFVQAFDKVIMFRGASLVPLEWNGINPAGFVAINKHPDKISYTAPIPNSYTAESFANRLLVPFDKDKVAVSDILDYTIYDKDLAVFWVNTGTADSLIRIFPYSQGNVIAFKGQSIAQYVNLQAPANVLLYEIDRSLGLAARKSPVIAGDSILFLSNPSGVRQLRQVVQGKLEVNPVPVSDAIAPIIRRINWRYAAGAVGKMLGDYYYLALPLDQATYNNAVLVLNTVTGQWESTPDQWEPEQLHIDDLHVTTYLGIKALYAIDRHVSSIYVLYVTGATTDELRAGSYPIRDLIETRGYGRSNEGETGWRRFKRAQIALGTTNPSVTVTAITDGVNEEDLLTETPITHVRGQYFNIAHPDYDPAAAGGFSDPLREDYTPVLETGLNLSAGVRLGLRQLTTERMQLRSPGSWCALRIANNQGQCEVRAISVEGQPTSNSRRAA